MLIGFCIAGLAGSPASWKPAWKVVMLLQTLRTHLACSTGYPPLCDAMTLLASPSYHRLPPGLVSIWMSCPLDVLQLLANSFASSFLDLLASKLLACSGDYLATHVVAKQLCRQGPGAWAGHQPRSVLKSFLCMWVNPFWEGWGEVCQHDFLSGVSIPVHSTDAGKSRDTLPFCGSQLACLLTNAFSMCVRTQQGRPTISGFESYKARVSATLQHICCMGRNCRVQAVHAAEKAPLLVCSVALPGCGWAWIPGGVYGRGHHLKSSLPSDLCTWKL